MTTDDGFTLINAFEVPENKLDESILVWEQGRDFLQKQPRYVSTALHQSINDDVRFRLINIAKWESVGSFMAATKKMRAEPSISNVEGLTPNAALYTVIRRD
jgi:heme oxygenase (mycobilin-producing)